MTVEREMTAAAADVWAHVKDIERYPAYTERVQRVVVTGEDGDVRDADWEVLLRGSLLRWSERAWISDERMSMRFTQTAGDLSYLSGEWSVTAGPPVRARLVIEFEIGIPLLARMLTPVATEALEENARLMLEAADRGPAP